jgi:hypothetical protein
MMIPESDSSFNPSDGWLMDILMKLGSAQTILSALCRSIENANPGIAVALVCPDRRTGKLTHIVAPNLSGRVSPSQLRLQYIVDEQRSAHAVGANGSKGQWSSGDWRNDTCESNLWSSGVYKLSAEHDVSLLVVWQSPESWPSVLDSESIQSAMSLAMRIFGRQKVRTHFPYFPEMLPQSQVSAS